MTLSLDQNFNTTGFVVVDVVVADGSRVVLATVVVVVVVVVVVGSNKQLPASYVAFQVKVSFLVNRCGWENGCGCGQRALGESFGEE